MHSNPSDFNDIFKPAKDAWKDMVAAFNLAMQCKMRRFYLVRKEDVDPDKTSGTGIIAEGVIFEDGVVALRWKTKYKSSVFYDNIDDVQAIHGHDGKTVIRYVDAQVAQ